ncbi:DUF3515 domain-containing protein [Streptomyces sp. NPDC001941]|uniref:DUF3515 domain-containing protein n=1 Tax=Streptomyces sp. NPDC001941 TaxID=3154659 RepID=UPI0033348984
MSSHRLPRLSAVLAAAALLTVTGCTGSDARATVAVPRPSEQETSLCRALHAALPKTVAGLERSDPEPDSELTAGWGDAAIVLRCGVPRPERMSDPQADSVDAGRDVQWLLEKRAGEGPRFTTVLRKAYVEVTLDERFAHDVAPLVDLAGPVARTVPKGP